MPYVDDLLDDGFIAAHLSALQHSHLRSNPGEEEEFPSLGHLIAHLDANVTESALCVREMSLELVKVLASRSADDLGSIEFHDHPGRSREEV